MRFDRKALVYAIGFEAVLAGLAAFGGPHGALGAWPWTLQMPGILLLFFVGGEGHIPLRVGSMVLIQCAVWYGVFSFARSFRRRRMTAGPGNPP